MWVNTCWINPRNIVLIKPVVCDANVPYPVFQVEIIMMDGTIVKPRDTFKKYESAVEYIKQLVDQKK
jgi:hypothetical protein